MNIRAESSNAFSSSNRRNDNETGIIKALGSEIMVQAISLELGNINHP